MTSIYSGILFFQMSTPNETFDVEVLFVYWTCFNITQQQQSHETSIYLDQVCFDHYDIKW